MTIFDGFDDFEYFDKTTVLIGVILFIVFNYLTSSIYQSAVLSMSILYIHYKYIQQRNDSLISKSVVNSYNNDQNYLDNIKLENYQNEIIKNTFPKAKHIHDYNNKTFLNFLFINQEFYYYNKQCWIEMIKNIDKFLEIYEDIIIDIKKSGIMFNSLKDLRDNALNELIAIKIKCPDNRNILEKINKAINDLDNIFAKYLYDISIKNEINIKNNGYNNHTVLIN